MEIDTTNLFLVSEQGETIATLRPVPQILTRGEALNLAAYIVALADPDHEEFIPLLEAILDA